MSGDGGIRFGSYALLRRIARGGMAEVFLAQQRGLEGFDRRVAVKRILPHLADSPDFVRMFLGEAKLAAQLTHPNIVHIYDFGKVDHDYFIAMEYVDGVHAGQLFECGERERLSPTLVARLGADAAAALHYAHELCGPSGAPLGIVHRDVSPANLMISFDGAVKLCDFGIAKAAAIGDQRTNPGQVKGKYGYMSPEQTTATPLDGRSDVFSLAIVLWELLAGRPIVPRGDAVAAMRAIRDGRLPRLAEVVPEAPTALAEAIGWALATRREERATAAQLATALEAFIKVSPELATPMQVSAWVRARFARDAGTGPERVIAGAAGGVGTMAAPGTLAGTEGTGRRQGAVTPPTPVALERAPGTARHLAHPAGSHRQSAVSATQSPVAAYASTDASVLSGASARSGASVLTDASALLDAAALPDAAVLIDDGRSTIPELTQPPPLDPGGARDHRGEAGGAGDGDRGWAGDVHTRSLRAARASPAPGAYDARDPAVLMRSTAAPPADTLRGPPSAVASGALTPPPLPPPPRGPAPRTTPRVDERGGAPPGLGPRATGAAPAPPAPPPLPPASRSAAGRARSPSAAERPPRAPRGADPLLGVETGAARAPLRGPPPDGAPRRSAGIPEHVLAPRRAPALAPPRAPRGSSEQVRGSSRAAARPRSAPSERAPARARLWYRAGVLALIAAASFAFVLRVWTPAPPLAEPSGAPAAPGAAAAAPGAAVATAGAAGTGAPPAGHAEAARGGAPAPLAHVPAAGNAPPPPRRYRVTTVPPGGAIRIGDAAHATPAEILLPPGRYQVVAELEGWAPEERAIEILDGADRVDEVVFTRPATSAMGTLTVRTTPYADVYLGTRRLGQAPFSDVEIPAGTHWLTFRNPLHPTVRKQVTIAPGRLTRLPPFQLPLADRRSP